MTRSPDAPERRITHIPDAEIIERAVDLALKKTFAILGVDIDRPESVEEFREDLRFGKRLRKMSDHGQLVMIGCLIAGIGFALWAGVKAMAGIK